MTTEALVAKLKSQGLTNHDIVQLFKESGRAGLEALAK